MRPVFFLPFALAACAGSPAPIAPPAAEVRPAAEPYRLQGRWAITAVNGRQVEGLWLELGGEGPGTVTRSGNGLLVGSPLPRTSAHLGCNDWHPNGWIRNGDKLTLGTEMSIRTERGCDPERMALDDQAYAILSRTMTIKVGALGRMRLFNEHGTLDLARIGTEAKVK